MIRNSERVKRIHLITLIMAKDSEDSKMDSLRACIKSRKISSKIKGIC